MLNRVVPATADGLPKPTRRQALRMLAAGGAAGALTAAAIVAAVPAGAAAPDPLFDLVNLYQATRGALDGAGIEDDDVFDAEMDRLVNPLWERLKYETPAATTEAGALAALRLASEEMGHTLGSFEAPLVAAALAYFDGRA
ncbi:hypothetical protein [Aureimonas sp. AU4]|uniref:hypothetical protein n=1 Tax=Aureimonas sp. AU4 TaxID=1638163 RepID=UPI0007837627|nr:hypothetical protein [Aureimonas sp. AU4]